MTYSEFIAMVARLSASGDPVDPDGDPCPNGFEHDTGDSLDALDEVIQKARKIVTAAKVPTKNFVENGWAFRTFKTTSTYGFWVYPKGARSHWDQRAEVRRSPSGCWIASINMSPMHAFHTFGDAKAHILKIIGRNDQ